MIEHTRRQYARAWKAWKKANHVRRALAALTGNRNGPAKAWADECRVMLARAERAHRRALAERQELHQAILRAFQIEARARVANQNPADMHWPN